MEGVGGVGCEARVVDLEAEGGEVLSYYEGVLLLAVHSDGKGFDPAHEEEGVEGGEGAACCVYN